MYDLDKINNTIHNENREFFHNISSSISILDNNNKIITEEHIFNGCDLNSYNLQFQSENISDLILVIESMNKKIEKVCNDILNYERMINQSRRTTGKKRNFFENNFSLLDGNKDYLYNSINKNYSIDFFKRKRTREDLENLSLLFNDCKNDSYENIAYEGKKFKK